MTTHSAGIDVGSGAIKISLLRADDAGRYDVLACRSERIRRRDVMEVVEEAFTETLAEARVARDTLDYTATTGEGDGIPWRNGHFYGITAHARGALLLDPEARAAVDIGALHARAMRFSERGRVLQYRMTSQCASGSGQFLENIARYLGVSIEEVGGLSLKADQPEKCSGICAVLAETDVINMVSRGITTSNILRGIHDSMALRLAGLLKNTGADGPVLLTGGLAQDKGLAAALRDRMANMKMPNEVRVHKHSVYAGAIGAAVWGAFRHAQRRGKTTHARS